MALDNAEQGEVRDPQRGRPAPARMPRWGPRQPRRGALVNVRQTSPFLTG